MGSRHNGPKRGRGRPDLSERIQAAVESWPPLSAEQRANLARLLSPVRGTAAELAWPDCTADDPPCAECRDGHA